MGRRRIAGNVMWRDARSRDRVRHRRDRIALASRHTSSSSSPRVGLLATRSSSCRNSVANPGDSATTWARTKYFQTSSSDLRMNRTCGAAATPTLANSGCSVRATGQLMSCNHSKSVGSNGSTTGNPAATIASARGISYLSRGRAGSIGSRSVSGEPRLYLMFNRIGPNQIVTNIATTATAITAVASHPSQRSR